MIRYLKTVLLLAAALPALAWQTPATSPAYHRVELKHSSGSSLPYTIEVPDGWELREDKGYPGLWIGPADAKLPSDPRLVWVRGSRTSLVDPGDAAAKVRAGDEKDASWSASVVEVKEVGGVKGVLVRMDSGEGAQARSTLVLKMPFYNMALDFMVSGPRAEFEKMLPVYEQILFSVRPNKSQPKPAAPPK
ncbi:MAG TPA: hypothetical protein VLT87_31265 [Thermoanaerobaculia bacterium]|nr:hypothetical protein [Thermoanaerobaculia bacterium]